LPAGNLHCSFSFELLRFHFLLRCANVLDQAETIGPIRALVFDDIHALLNKMQTESAGPDFLEFAHAQLRALDGRATIAQKNLETLGGFVIRMTVNGAEGHFNGAVGPAFVRMANDIGERLVNGASDGAAFRLGESERFGKTFHGSAHRAEQAGIAGQFEPQQQATAGVSVALFGFVSPNWMQNFHVNLSFAMGSASPAKRSHRTVPSTSKSLVNARTAAPSSHGEQRRNRDPQAWAEFCLAYCKRLGPLLAIPAIKIWMLWTGG
jgi:hypothetical protein